MTNHKDPKTEKPVIGSSGQSEVNEKTKDVSSSSVSRSSEGAIEATITPPAVEVTSEKAERSVSVPIQEEDVIADSLAKLDLSKKTGSENLSESSLDSDGDASCCESDLDSDGLSDEGLVERGLQRKGHGHGKPYDRPSRKTSDEAKSLLQAQANSSGARECSSPITPEDYDLLQNLDFLKDDVEMCSQIQDVESILNIPDAEVPNNATGSSCSYQDHIINESVSGTAAQNLNQFNNVEQSTMNPGAVLADVLPPHPTNQHTGVFRADQTTLCHQVDSQAVNTYLPINMMQMTSLQSQPSLTYTSLTGQPSVADNVVLQDDTVSQASIPTVVADKLNEVDPPKKPKRKRVSRKKASQAQPGLAESGASYSPPDPCNHPFQATTCAPSLTSTYNEQNLRDAYEFIQQEHNASSTTSQPVAYGTNNFQGFQGLQLPLTSTNQTAVYTPNTHTPALQVPYLGSQQTMPPPSTSQIQPPLVHLNGGPGTQITPPHTISSFVQGAPVSHLTHQGGQNPQINGYPNTLVNSAFVNTPFNQQPNNHNLTTLFRPLRPNSAQHKLTTAGSFGAASQQYFAFCFQPVLLANTSPLTPIRPTPK